MNRPQMIIFDYGQTLMAERLFDSVRGTAAVMRHAVRNKYNLTPEQIQEEAGKIHRELFLSGVYDTVEIPNRVFNGLLYESLGIKIDLSADEIDRIFWDASAPGKPTEGLPEFLDYLWAKGIKTAVLSNIPYSGNVVSDRINRLLPDNHFEFIIASSEYIFKKPNPMIFRLALEKAEKKPEDVWFVGDNYACDVVGAKNAGMFPIWYTGAVDVKDDHNDILRISAWTELKYFIEKCDY